MPKTCKNVKQKVLIENREGEQTCHLVKLQTCHSCVHQIWTSRALLCFSLRRLEIKTELVCHPNFGFQTVTYHHVIDIVVWVSLTPDNELCSRLGESGIKTFPYYTVNLDAPSCTNGEVLEVDGLNFWVFLPVHLKQRHSPIVASHLKYGNKLLFSVEALLTRPTVEVGWNSAPRITAPSLWVPLLRS